MNIGKLKIWFERSRMWLSIFQFAMISYIFLVEQTLGNAWLIMLGVMASLAIITIIDVKFIMPGELAESCGYNPFFVDMQRDLKKIKKRLKVGE